MPQRHPRMTSDIEGNILDHEYTFTDGRTAAATVSKRRFRVADTYGVKVPPGQNPVGILARHGRTRRHGPPGSVIRLNGGLNRRVLVTVAPTPAA
jgi:hypothetical protein